MMEPWVRNIQNGSTGVVEIPYFHPVIYFCLFLLVRHLTREIPESHKLAIHHNVLRNTSEQLTWVLSNDIGYFFFPHLFHFLPENIYCNIIARQGIVNGIKLPCFKTLKVQTIIYYEP